MTARAFVGIAVALVACSGGARYAHESEVTTTSARIEAPGITSTVPPEPRAVEPVPVEGPAPVTLPTRVQPPGAGLGDSRIVAVVAAANDREIQQAKLALTRARDVQVRELAQLIYDHRRDARTKQEMLAASRGIAAQPSRISAQITAEGDAALASLDGLSRALDFDKAYVALLAREQRSLLDVIDYELMPTASDIELRKWLYAFRPLVAEDLVRASDLQVRLSKP